MPGTVQRRLAVLAFTLIACNARAADGDAPDPGALAALVKMGEHLRGLQQYALDAESDSDQLLENGQALVVHASTRLLVSAPDKLQVQVTGAEYQRSLFYDGQHFTLYDSRQGYFGRDVAPTSQEELLALLGERYGIQRRWPTSSSGTRIPRSASASTAPCISAANRSATRPASTTPTASPASIGSYGCARATSPCPARWC